jgi:hypothetical protein
MRIAPSGSLDVANLIAIADDRIALYDELARGCARDVKLDLAAAGLR